MTMTWQKEHSLKFNGPISYSLILTHLNKHSLSLSLSHVFSPYIFLIISICVFITYYFYIFLSIRFSDFSHYLFLTYSHSISRILSIYISHMSLSISFSNILSLSLSHIFSLSLFLICFSNILSLYFSYILCLSHTFSKTITPSICYYILTYIVSTQSLMHMHHSLSLSLRFISFRFLTQTDIE